MRFYSPSLFLAFVALVSAGPQLRAQDGLSGAWSDLEKTQVVLHTGFAQGLAAADFDRDARPDGAVLMDAGVFEGRRRFRIKLHFTNARNRELTFESSETALQLATPDLNRDGVPDLVVEQVFTHKRLQVWLNNGHGEFRSARVQDYPSMETPSRWRFRLEGQTGLVLALPFRSENDHAIQILEFLRSGSSSSLWRVGSSQRHVQLDTASFSYPRSPPALLTL